MKEAGHEPGPKKGPGTWDDFLKRHSETLWQCDFFSKWVISRLGTPQLFAMVLINVATRRVWVSPAIRNPTEAWVVERAKSFIAYAEAEKLKVEMVTRDNDQIYKQGFDCVLQAGGRRLSEIRNLRAQHQCLRRAVHPVDPGRVFGPFPGVRRFHCSTS